MSDRRCAPRTRHIGQTTGQAARGAARRGRGVAQDGAQDLGRRAHRARDGAAHLAAPDARAVVDGNLGHAQPRPPRLDLHLDRPAVVPVPHVEAGEGGAGDGAEGPEVAGAGPDEQVHERHAEPRARHRVPGMASGRGAPAGARADHQVPPGRRDGPDDVRQLSGMVAVVAVEERARRRCRPGGDSGEARLPVSAGAARPGTRAAGGAGDLRCPMREPLSTTTTSATSGRTSSTTRPIACSSSSAGITTPMRNPEGC